MNKLFKIIKKFFSSKDKKLLDSFIKNKKTLVARGISGEILIHECFCNELILANQIIKNTPEKNKSTVVCESCNKSVFFDKKAIKNLDLFYSPSFKKEITIYTYE
jgi:hypothetical protein